MTSAQHSRPQGQSVLWADADLCPQEMVFKVLASSPIQRQTPARSVARTVLHSQTALTHLLPAKINLGKGRETRLGLL